MDYAILFPWGKKELLKEVFVYSSHSKLKEFRESCGLCRGEQSMVKTEVCLEGEPVCNDESGDPQVLSFLCMKHALEC